MDSATLSPWDMANAIEKKLRQAKGVCGAVMTVEGVDSLIADALSAAESLIEDAEELFTEFRNIDHEHTAAEEVQS